MEHTVYSSALSICSLLQFLGSVCSKIGLDWGLLISVSCSIIYQESELKTTLIIYNFPLAMQTFLLLWDPQMECKQFYYDQPHQNANQTYRNNYCLNYLKQLIYTYIFPIVLGDTVCHSTLYLKDFVIPTIFPPVA